MNQVFNLMYDGTGTRIFTAGDDNLVKISTLSGYLQLTVRGHVNRPNSENSIQDIDISVDNTTFATAGSDKNVRVWCLKTISQLSFLHIGKEINIVRFSPTGEILVVGCADGRARVYFKETTHGGYHPEPVILEAGTLTKDNINSIQFDISGNRFVVGSDDGNMYLYSIKAIQNTRSRVMNGASINIVPPNFIFEHHRAPINQVNISSTGTQLVSGCRKGVVCSYTFDGSGFRKKVYCLNKESDYISAENDGATVTELSGQDAVVPDNIGDEIEAKDSGAWLVQFNRDSSRLIVATTDNFINIHDPTNLDLMHKLKFHSSSIAFLDCHFRNRNLLLSGDLDGNVCVWDVFSGALLYSDKISEMITAGSFSPGEIQFSICDSKGNLHVYGCNEVLHDVPEQQFHLGDFATIREDAYGLIYDAETGLLANPVQGEVVSMQRVAYTRTEAMKIAKNELVDNNWCLEELIFERDTAIEMDSQMGWSKVDSRSF
jgi:WD40 repeat protein